MKKLSVLLIGLTIMSCTKSTKKQDLEFLTKRYPNAEILQVDPDSKEYYIMDAVSTRWVILNRGYPKQLSDVRMLYIVKDER